MQTEKSELNPGGNLSFLSAGLLPKETPEYSGRQKFWSAGLNFPVGGNTDCPPKFQETTFLT